MTLISGHGGTQAVAVARRYGVTAMFTLSGGHVFPLYDAAVKADPPVRLVDVRHEQTAVFAAEATARLTRAPGLAVVTAGPGVTNSVSAVTTAWFNGAPLVLLGGRAPDYLWGRGALQEMDQVTFFRPITKTEIHPDTGREVEVGVPILRTYTVFNLDQAEGARLDRFRPQAAIRCKAVAIRASQG